MYQFVAKIKSLLHYFEKLEVYIKCKDPIVTLRKLQTCMIWLQVLTLTIEHVLYEYSDH